VGVNGTVKVIEWMGLPNGGKTEISGIIERELTRLGKSVRSIQDQIKDAPVEGIVERNLWAISKIKKLIIEAREHTPDLIIVERGAGAIFASLDAFLKLEGFLTDREQRKAASLAKDEAFLLRKYTGFFILIEVDSGVAMDREVGQTTPGTIINPDFLNALTKSYNRLKKELAKSRVMLVDGNVDHRTESYQRCNDRILQKLLRLMPPGITDRE